MIFSTNIQLATRSEGTILKGINYLNMTDLKTKILTVLDNYEVKDAICFYPLNCKVNRKNIDNIINQTLNR